MNSSRRQHLTAAFAGNRGFFHQGGEEDSLVKSLWILTVFSKFQAWTEPTTVHNAWSKSTTPLHGCVLKKQSILLSGGEEDSLVKSRWVLARFSEFQAWTEPTTVHNAWSKSTIPLHGCALKKNSILLSGAEEDSLVKSRWVLARSSEFKAWTGPTAVHNARSKSTTPMNGGVLKKQRILSSGRGRKTA